MLKRTMILLLLLSPAALAKDLGNPDRGMEIFSTYCASCHGLDGQGDGPMAGRLMRDYGVAPANLGSQEFQSDHSDAQLRKAIKGGGAAVHKAPYMPAWGTTLTDRQVTDLISFVRELREPVPGQSPKADILDIQTHLELGRTLFSVHCSACHGRTGKGGGPLLESWQVPKAPPDLTQRSYFLDRTDRELARFVLSGLDHAGAGQEKVSRWWHRALEPHEVDALIFYLRSLPVSRK